MDENDNIKNRIIGWLNKEGYPLEYKTANVFRQNGFHTFQGHYIIDYKKEIPREIDILVQCTIVKNNSIIGINYVVECKNIVEKPWLIFTDSSCHISTKACITQSIATKSMATTLERLAEDLDIQQLSIFQSPDKPGYNGKQAFGGEKDTVYSTLQSVISACYSIKENFDNSSYSNSFDFLLIPIIVVDGRLFETFYNVTAGKIDIEEKQQIRIHWKGSEAWRLHSTIDVITIESLPNYVNKLYQETIILMKKLEALFIQSQSV